MARRLLTEFTRAILSDRDRCRGATECFIVIVVAVAII